METLFNLHNVFSLKDKNHKQCVTVVRTSDKKTQKAINNTNHYLLVKDTKKLLKKLMCEHCSAVISKLENYKKTYPCVWIVYDFEALFKQINKKTFKTEYINKHIPVTYSLCDHKANTKSRVHGDATELINHFIQYLLEMRKKL